MAKRVATSELNHDNWNEEDAPEEAGTFSKAAPDVMQNRIIKAAKRRSHGTPDNSLATKSPFAAFGGFKASSGNTASPFSFLSSGESTASNKASNGKTDKSSKSDDTHSPEYYSSLKGLNQGVSQWIKSHVDTNPFCILTPIFKDYERYLAEIDEKEAKRSKGGSSEKSAPASTPKEENSKPPPTEEKKEPTNLFATSTPKFNFGSGNSSTTSASAGFTFAGTKPSFTFTNVTKSEESIPSSRDGDGEGDEDEPPKVEFKPVEEEGATYSKRCKVYVKKESAFQERGVGTLFLKPLPGGEKTQLIVRADTSLGNILVNTLLASGMPAQRMGTNNVMLVCVPTPDTKPPPIPVLLKLKTSADADEVLAKLQEHVK